MRFGRPSPALVVAVIAVVIALAGTAFAATGQLVNIADPTNANRLARVDSAGKLSVGDASGAMTVDGTTTEAPANALFRSAAFPSATCGPIATPPAGRALIVKAITLNTLGITSSPGPGKYAAFYVGANGCDSWVMDFNPSTIGLMSQPFEPGLAVPSGRRLWAVSENIQSEAFVFGYTVPANAVPAAAAAASRSSEVRSKQR
jgi:hypothetical protein